MAIDWNAIYRQKWEEAKQAADARQNILSQEQSRDESALKAAYDGNINALKAERDGALNRAYVTMRRAEKYAPELLKQNGISGGYTESTAASLLRSYQNARNDAENAYISGAADLSGSYNTDAVALKNRYAALLAELLKQRDADVLSRAKIAFDAANDAERAEEERRRWEAEFALQKARYDDEVNRASDKSITGGVKQSMSPSEKYFASGGTWSNALNNLADMLEKERNKNDSVSSKYMSMLLTQTPMDIERNPDGTIKNIRAAKAWN